MLTLKILMFEINASLDTLVEAWQRTRTTRGALQEDPCDSAGHDLKAPGDVPGGPEAKTLCF